jgi:hypothetical protein
MREFVGKEPPSVIGSRFVPSGGEDDVVSDRVRVSGQRFS